MATYQFRIRLIQLHPNHVYLDEGKTGIGLDERPGIPMPYANLSRLAPMRHESAPRYTALSYTWGDQNVCKPTIIDGRKVTVTTNLEAALQYLREQISRPLMLWVDSLCIDQDDSEEKSRQVAHMRDIYAQAEEVICWLGDGTCTPGIRWLAEYGSRAKALGIGQSEDMLLKNLLERCDDTTEGAGKGTMVSISRSDDEHRFVTDLKRVLGPHSNPDYYELIEALQDFLERPYWRRIWIVQEVTVARITKFVCGKESVGREIMYMAIRLLRNFALWQVLKLGHDPSEHFVTTTNTKLDNSRNESVIPINPGLIVQLLRLGNTGDTGMPMMYLLRRLVQSQATDDRDRVFALLGLATDAKDLHVDPDYTKSCAQCIRS